MSGTSDEHEHEQPAQDQDADQQLSNLGMTQAGQPLSGDEDLMDIRLTTTGMPQMPNDLEESKSGEDQD